MIHPKETVIQLLSEQRFCSFNKWLTSNSQSGNEAGVEATCTVMLQHPKDAQPNTFFAKFFRHPRTMANEIAGYVFAHHYGLPLPPRASIARIPLNKLDMRTISKRHQWLKDTAKKNGFYSAFCTEAVNAPTPYHHYGGAGLEIMAANIRKWDKHIQTLTFDDIIANLDRHLNNLLRIGDSSYALIDHGRLVVQNGLWKADDLKPDGAFDNRLLNILYHDPSVAANGMVDAAEDAGSLLAGAEEVQYWLNHLAPKESQAFDNFVQARTITAATRIAKRYALC